MLTGRFEVKNPRLHKVPELALASLPWNVMRRLFLFAFFQPQSLIDELLLYKRSEDQIELKEKQLSTMRVDVCSTETLKCLKGKALRALKVLGELFSSVDLGNARIYVWIMPEFQSEVKNQQSGAKNLG